MIQPLCLNLGILSRLKVSYGQTDLGLRFCIADLCAMIFFFLKKKTTTTIFYSLGRFASLRLVVKVI